MRMALFTFLWLVSWPTLVLFAESRAVFRAGAAAIDITPDKLPVSMTGGFQDRKATGAHDRLHARCLVLDDGEWRSWFATVV